MNERVLLGSVAAKLEANGYIPTSVSSPGNRGHRHADDDGAILLVPTDNSCGFKDADSRRVITLSVVARAPKVRADILEVFKRFKLDAGPCRVASDNSLTFVLRYEEYGHIYSRESAPAVGESEAAVSLVGSVHVDPMGNFALPNALRVAGTWKNGDLLSVPRAKLAALDDARADSVFAAVAKVLEAHEPPFDYEQYKASLKPSAPDPMVYQPKGFEGHSAPTLGPGNLETTDDRRAAMLSKAS